MEDFGRHLGSWGRAAENFGHALGTILASNWQLGRHVFLVFEGVNFCCKFSKMFDDLGIDFVMCF